MKDYSQNGEQKIILEYFKDKYKGKVLDIGANDGITLSNSRALIEKGWNGVLIEPAPSVYPLLTNNIKGYSVQACNMAIGTKTGKMTLHESDSHLVKGENNNLGLLSTLKPSEIDRWKGTQVFTPVEVKVMTWNDFLEATGLSAHYDFITIDAEGLDFEILEQIDLIQTSMVCIEWNYNRETREKVLNYCGQFGLLLRYTNAENLILTR